MLRQGLKGQQISLHPHPWRAPAASGQMVSPIWHAEGGLRDIISGQLKLTPWIFTMSPGLQTKLIYRGIWASQLEPR